MPIILLCLFFVIFLDTILLKKRDRPLFRKVFAIAPAKAAVGILLILVISIFSGDKTDDLPALILLLIPPLYLLRRNRFISTAPGAVARPLRLLSGALGVIVMWMYGVLVFGFVLSGLTDVYPQAVSEMGEMLLSAVFSFILIMGLVYRASGEFSGGGFMANVGLRKGGRPWAKAVLVPLLLGLFFALFSSYLILQRQIQPQTPLGEVIETTRSVNLMLVFLFLAVFIAPLIEEIVFRGYFFYVIKEWLGTNKAIYIIALTFAFLHVGQYWGDWLAIMMVAALGLTLTVLRAWSGTTLAGVITHYVYNGGVTIIPVVMIAVSNPAYFEYKIYYPHHDAQTKEALLKESIAKRPDWVDAYNDLAWLYAEEERNLEEALALVEQALQFAPRQPAYLDTKAEVLEKLGRHNEAKPIRENLRGKLP